MSRLEAAGHDVNLNKDAAKLPPAGFSAPEQLSYAYFSLVLILVFFGQIRLEFGSSNDKYTSIPDIRIPMLSNTLVPAALTPMFIYCHHSLEVCDCEYLYLTRSRFAKQLGSPHTNGESKCVLNPAITGFRNERRNFALHCISILKPERAITSLTVSTIIE